MKNSLSVNLSDIIGKPNCLNPLITKYVFLRNKLNVINDEIRIFTYSDYIATSAYLCCCQK